MKSFFSDFKKFITRGNVLDMAVGVIVGGAFTAIVTALNKSILTPFIGYLFGTKDLKSLYYPLPGSEVLEGQVDIYGNQLYSSAIYYGEFIQAVIDFLMIALLLFSIVKIFQWVKRASEKTAEKLKKKEEQIASDEPITEAPVTPKPTTEELLTEIRDLLANKSNSEIKK